MSKLPDAVVQYPACGCCGSGTRFDENGFICEDCLLKFDLDWLSASFLDPRAEPCGAACDNSWHGDHRIRQGHGYNCGTCMLPAGHESMHWTGCQPKQVV
ncbi:Uncharacterised protein [Mycobacteroides abscessus subsp. abscessus]|nr:Uncharacterised protein [Mycobacteroides abscessus subsp. abscessus]SKV09880.1 Uncharacterised protein [Mycobacteroides abscessus subsp. abscessus]SLI18385.1 Uncharacterised protein [Mycobacteroides abscessus subsp. massiliense]